MKLKIFMIALAVCVSALLLANVMGSIKSEHPLYTNISLAEYQKKIVNGENFSIYVYQTSCRACQTFKPIVNKVMRTYNKNIYALNLDKDQNRDISFLKEQQINVTPTMVRYADGKKIKKKEGVQTEKELENFLNWK